MMKCELRLNFKKFALFLFSQIPLGTKITFIRFKVIKFQKKNVFVFV